MPRKQPLILLLTFFTLLNGLGNLLAAANPSPHSPHHLLPLWLRELFPLEFSHFPHSFTLLLGFAWWMAAVNVYRREARAWQLTPALTTFPALT